MQLQKDRNDIETLGTVIRLQERVDCYLLKIAIFPYKFLLACKISAIQLSAFTSIHIF